MTIYGHGGVQNKRTIEPAGDKPCVGLTAGMPAGRTTDWPMSTNYGKPGNRAPNDVLGAEDFKPNAPELPTNLDWHLFDRVLVSQRIEVPASTVQRKAVASTGSNRALCRFGRRVIAQLAPRQRPGRCVFLMGQAWCAGRSCNAIPSGLPETLGSSTDNLTGEVPARLSGATKAKIGI